MNTGATGCPHGRNRRKPATPGVSAALVLCLAAGCNFFIAKETLYLRSAQDHATLEDVRKNLGQPTLTANTPGGEPVWLYEVYQQEPGSQQSWAAYGSWCDEYVLTFDTGGVLRQWTHKIERHGGEMSPTFCVLDGFRRTS